MSNPKKKASWYAVKAAVNGTPPEVYIYDEIGYWGVTAKEFVNEIAAIDSEEITLRLNTPGGSVYEGMAIYNALLRHPAKINVYIDGLAASMGSVIALAGDTINMAENAYYMIHNPWGGCFGESSDLRKYADRLDDMTQQIANIYQAKTGLERESILQAMTDETWYSGQEALAAGFVGNLTERLDAAACYHGTEAASRFSKPPINIVQARIDQEPQQPVRKSNLIAAKHQFLRSENSL